MLQVINVASGWFPFVLLSAIPAIAQSHIAQCLAQPLCESVREGLLPESLRPQKVQHEVQHARQTAEMRWRTELWSGS